ncbi:MAG: hypothetical protein GQ535_13460 [Rhodobacteraceae bacterium]|nr:hypothetical protein [Paracoccaceae bacterium]
MDIFILVGAGILGAAIMASQSHNPVSTLFKLVLGSIGGAFGWLFLGWLNSLPEDPSLSGFIMMFVIGALFGGLVMLLGIYLNKLR